MLSGLKCSCNVGLSMGLSICCRGTRTGGRTEKKKLILQFSHIHVQNVGPGIMRTLQELKRQGKRSLGALAMTMVIAGNMSPLFMNKLSNFQDNKPVIMIIYT